MIIATQLKNSNIERVMNVFNKYNTEIEKKENEIIYVLEENNNIIGISKATILNNISKLNFLVIDEKSRGFDFGDGLLRALLNCLYLKGIEKVYFGQLNSYLIKKGFTKIECNLLLKEIFDYDCNIEILTCDLEVFFSKGCKGAR